MTVTMMVKKVVFVLLLVSATVYDVSAMMDVCFQCCGSDPVVLPDPESIPENRVPYMEAVIERMRCIRILFTRDWAAGMCTRKEVDRAYKNLLHMIRDNGDACDAGFKNVIAGEASRIVDYLNDLQGCRIMRATIYQALIDGGYIFRCPEKTCCELAEVIVDDATRKLSTCSIVDSPDDFLLDSGEAALENWSS